MRRLVVSTLIMLWTATIQAQYTEIINSKRPGRSESPYGVGINVLQVEGGFFYGASESDQTFAQIDPRGFTSFFRYGALKEKLEFNALITYQQNELQFNNIFTSSSTISGISELTIGAKYLIFQQEFEDKSKEIRSWKKRTAFDKKRLIPSVGIYAGINTNFLSEAYEEEGISPKVGVLLQNDFSHRLVLLTNFIADKIGNNKASYAYILTMTYALSPRWSIFVEHEGAFFKNYSNDYYLGTGLAYLFSPDLQMDGFVRTNFDSVNTELIAGVGASYRFDWHVDPELESGDERPKTKKGLFSGLFKKNSK